MEALSESVTRLKSKKKKKHTQGKQNLKIKKKKLCQLHKNKTLLCGRKHHKQNTVKNIDISCYRELIFQTWRAFINQKEKNLSSSVGKRIINLKGNTYSS